MSILIIVAIVALVVWLIYRGMQRQNARFENAAPVTQVLDTPLTQAAHQAVFSDPIDAVPLYVNMQQSFRGDHEKIVQTINDVGDMLQKEVDTRTYPDGPTAQAARVDHETYRNLVSQQTNRLMLMFQDAELSFEQASSPNGRPEVLRQGYAAILDQLIAAARSLGSTQAPPTYAQTQVAFREFLKEFYSQIAAWPQRLRDASKDVIGDSCDVMLTAECDVGPMQRAIQSESAG